MTLQTRDKSLRFVPVKLIAALVSMLLVPLALPATVLPGANVVAAPPGDEEVVAFVVRGVGNGHGRGMSQ